MLKEGRIYISKILKNINLIFTQIKNYQIKFMDINIE